MPSATPRILLPPLFRPEPVKLTGAPVLGLMVTPPAATVVVLPAASLVTDPAAVVALELPAVSVVVVPALFITVELPAASFVVTEVTFRLGLSVKATSAPEGAVALAVWVTPTLPSKPVTKLTTPPGATLLTAVLPDVVRFQPLLATFDTCVS